MEDVKNSTYTIYCVTESTKCIVKTLEVNPLTTT